MNFFNFNASWRLRCLVLVVLVSNVAAAALLPPYETRNSDVFPAIFHFGDSNSDTGSTSAVFFPVKPPNGMTFFGKPSGRFCDGRLSIDFIAERLQLPYLSPYMDGLEGKYKHGANFAVGGTTITPVDGDTYALGLTPISLNLQLLQFYHLKSRVTELHKQDETSVFENRLPKPEDFSKALYTFDIGQNDIALLIALTSEDRVFQSLHDLIDRFSPSIEQLHELGARRFVILNIGPMGCLPMYVERYPADSKIFDDNGCIKSHNEVAKEYNRLLKARVSLLRTKLEGSSIEYVDMYSAKYGLITNAKRYGFVDPLKQCCEDCMKGDEHYWTRTVAELIKEEVPTACENPSKYISWDGMHYSDAANHWIARHIFDGSAEDPLVKLSNITRQPCQMRKVSRV